VTEPVPIIDLQLASLARQANEHHAAVQQHESGVLREAIAAGHALLAARSHVAEGAWLAWIKTNCAFTERTARRYLAVARDAQADSPVSGPTFRKALKQIAAKRAAREPTTPGTGTPDAPSQEGSQEGTNVVPLNTATRPLAKRTRGTGTPTGREPPNKGRQRSRKLAPGTPTPRQGAFVEAPKFFEDMLIALEQCTTIYGYPDIAPVLQTLMKQRIGRAKVAEMIDYLKKVADTMGE